MQVDTRFLPYASSDARIQPKVGAVLNFDTALTKDDKAIVKAATGYDADNPTQSGTLHVPQLAAAIAISRSQGSLKGPVTENFLQQYGGVSALGQDTISKALSFIKSRIQSASDLLDKSLNIVG